MSEPQWLTADEQQAWRSFLRVQGLLPLALNRGLQASGSDLSLSDFGVLVMLSEAPGRRMRVLELARALQWEKSRLSHQLRRMAERGLVSRSNCSEDKRGAFIEITADGLAAVEAAAPPHVATVRANFFDALDEQDVADLARICAAVTKQIEQDCGEPCE
jgi:DNA-binding MarR family transcriptional regulator